MSTGSACGYLSCWNVRFCLAGAVIGFATPQAGQNLIMRLSRKGQSKLSPARARAGDPRSNEKAIRPGGPKHFVERTKYEWSSATLPAGAFRLPWTTGTYPVDEVNESCRTESSPMQQVERCCFRK